MVLVAAVAVVGLGAFLLLSGDDDNNGDSPEDVVRSFIAADNDNDCEAMLGLATPAGWNDLTEQGDYDDALNTCESSIDALEREGITISYTLHNVEVLEDDDDRAVVEADATQVHSDASGEESIDFEQELTLIRDDGDWKIDRFGLVTEK